MPEIENRLDAARLLIVRIAGLPASSMAPLGSPECLRRLLEIEALEGQLSEARSDLEIRLYQAAASAPDRLRRLLLTAKRHCFNHRSLLPLRRDPEWESLRERIGAPADRVVSLEEQERSLWEEYDPAFHREWEREALHLRRLTEDRGFRRGLALSSHTLIDNLARLEVLPVSQYGRKERRACQSLLRYASRAAFKLSPFSTLTRLALGTRVDAPGTPRLQLRGAPDQWAETSLVRLRRYLLQQLAAVLLTCPELRDPLPVQLNLSLTETGPDLYHLLSPGGWDLPGNGQLPRYRQPSLRDIPLSRALVDWLREQVSSGIRWSDLRHELARTLEGDGGEERAGALVNRLHRIGLIEALPPWSPEDPRLEERLAAWLRARRETGPLSAAAASLAQIVHLEEGFHQSERPDDDLREIDRHLEAAWRAALTGTGRDVQAPLYRSKENEIFEDVLVLPKDASRPALAEVETGQLAEALHSLTPWFRLIDLDSPRYEILHTLAALAERHSPGTGEVRALDLFRETLPLWQEIRNILKAPPSSGSAPRPLFNPLALPEVERLGEIRKDIWREAHKLLRKEGGDLRLSSQDLTSLLDARLPPQYAPPLGPCVFLQPADAAGDLWVLNRIFEGTGRYGSRFTAVLPERIRAPLLEHLVRCSVLRQDSGNLELLDLLSAQGDTLNVHPLQTDRVLTLPGEPICLKPGRLVGLSDLKVRLDGPLPRLTDAAGQALLPVYLGGAALAFTPAPIAFLALLGPCELRPIPVPRTARQQGEVQVFDRVVLDRIVLSRQRWVIPADALRARLTDPAPRAFAALDRWRRSAGLPERVFAIERVHFEGASEVYKPQYLDLTSPLFFGVLEAVLRSCGDFLVLEEVLPLPEALPLDDQGEAWAMELQVEALGWTTLP